MTRRQCLHCGSIVPESKNPGAVRLWCPTVTCQRARQRSTQRRWRVRNPDDWRSRYYFDHEAQKAKRRSWYAANSERHKLLCKQWRKENPEQAKRINRNGHLKRTFGISIEEFARMAGAQGNACAICRRTDAKLMVDHDHGTGGVRGLLCYSCNVALGHFRDDPALLESACRYLQASVSIQASGVM